MPSFKFQPDDRVRNTLTGLEGVVTGATTWLNNCSTYLRILLERADRYDDDAIEASRDLAEMGDQVEGDERLPALAPFQQRVVEEKEALDLRLEALTRFTLSDAFTQVHLMEQERLNCQRHLMCQYSAILGERIRNFEEGM